MSTPDEVRKAAELKQWLEDRLAELQDEVDRLRETLVIVDENLRATTFMPAIELIDEAKEIQEKREIKRDKGGEVIATASVTARRVSVVPKEGVQLKVTTPPFKSFLMGKILEGMKVKDEELVSTGKLKEGEELSFLAKEEDGKIVRLTIENYRDKARLNELLSTIGWTFSRMLEK